MASTSSGPNEDFLIVVVGPSGAQRSLTPSFASFDFGGIADHAYAILFEGGKPFLIGGGYNVMTGGDSFAFLSLLR
jgi:hypothetical protein